MRQLLELKDEECIEIAKLIDNAFKGNDHIRVIKKGEKVRVIGHTIGGQCINCDVVLHFNYSDNKIRAIFIQNDDKHTEGAYRPVYPPTLKRILDYLTARQIDY